MLAGKCPGCGGRLHISSTKPAVDYRIVYYKCHQQGCRGTSAIIEQRAADVKAERDKAKAQANEVYTLRARVSELELQLAERTHAAPEPITPSQHADEQLHDDPSEHPYDCACGACAAMAADAEGFEEWSKSNP